MKNIAFLIIAMLGALIMSTEAQTYTVGKNQLYLLANGSGGNVKISVNNIVAYTHKGGSAVSAQVPLELFSHPGQNTVKIEATTPWAASVRRVAAGAMPDEGTQLGTFTGATGTFEYTLTAADVPAYDWLAGQNVTEADCTAVKAAAQQLFTALSQKDAAAYSRLNAANYANAAKLYPPQYAQQFIAGANEAASLDGWSLATDIECHISTNNKLISLNQKGETWLFYNVDKANPDSTWPLGAAFFKNAEGKIVPALTF